MASSGKKNSNVFGFNLDVYDVISWIGLVFTPLAPAGFFGVRVYDFARQISDGAMSEANSVLFSSAAAIVFASALECLGLLAGHSVIGTWQEIVNGKLGRIPLGILMLAVLICYALMGLYELSGYPTGQMAFLMAPLMYITKGAHIVQKKWQEEEAAEAERKAQQQAAEIAHQQAQKQNELQTKKQADEIGLLSQQQAAEIAHKKQLLELEQQAKEAETQRQLAIANAKWEHEAQIKKLEIEAKQAKRSGRSGAQLAGNMPQVANQNVYQYTDWRTVPEDVKRLVAEMTPEEIGRTFPHLAERTCREWRKKARQFVGKE